MHLLHRALDEDSRLREIINRLSNRVRGNPLKHALVLDLNPFWLTAYRLVEAGFSEDVLLELYRQRGFSFDAGWPLRAGGFRFDAGWPLRAGGFRFDAGWPSWSAGGPLDLSRTFSSSAELTSKLFGSRSHRSAGKRHDGPFILRIFAKPATTIEGHWVEHRNNLVQAARITPLPTVIETQEMARLLASPGDRLHSATGVAGTLGGFLKDGPRDLTYAVTCGHVISAGMASTSTGLLGGCVHATLPTPLPPGVQCSTLCGSMTELDVALINVQGAAVPNVATSLAQTVNPRDIIDMHGASSGTKRYEVGGVVVEHEIGGYCWNRLFLFHAPMSVGLLPPAVNVALTRAPTNGDSGAWLLRNGGEWVGMVVAANALHGFALASTLILTRASAALNAQLRLA